MVYRIYVEKKSGLQNEANALASEIKTFLGIDSVESVRILNRYDAENISEELFDYAVKTVFSEPQLDNATKELDAKGGVVFAAEYLPGQFDQRADSAAQCIQLISQGEKPTVNSARAVQERSVRRKETAVGAVLVFKKIPEKKENIDVNMEIRNGIAKQAPAPIARNLRKLFWSRTAVAMSSTNPSRAQRTQRMLMIFKAIGRGDTPAVLKSETSVITEEISLKKSKNKPQAPPARTSPLLEFFAPISARTAKTIIQREESTEVTTVPANKAFIRKLL